jgi:hexokinase
LDTVKNLLKNNFGVDNNTLEDRRLIKRCCELVAKRAAILSATAIAAVISKTKKLNCTVAIDGNLTYIYIYISISISILIYFNFIGSVFENTPNFKVQMENTLKDLLPESNVSLELTRDGSGIGSAIIAACAITTNLI